MDLQISIKSAVTLVLTFIGAVGGAGVIILAVSKWFGDFLATRMLDHYNNKQKAELEGIKSHYRQELETTKLELEKAKTSFVRYSDKQFDLYNNLWFSLLYVKRQADDLWKIADPAKIPGFAEQVRLAKNVVEDNMLLIEQDHYDKLMVLIGQFEQFKIGKLRLIEIRSEDGLTPPNITQKEADNFISQNQKTKKSYDKFILEIGQTFRDQIKG